MQSEAGMTETKNSKTEPQNGELDPETSKTTPKLGLTEIQISLTETNTSKAKGENTEGERLTDGKTPKKSGRPAKLASSTAVTWSVRGVERETQAIIEKAAERTGKTLGQYLNDDVRGFAQGQLSQAETTGQAVASPRDLQVQVEQLTQLVEGIAVA